jgi:hypothetical protein
MGTSATKNAAARVWSANGKGNWENEDSALARSFSFARPHRDVLLQESIWMPSESARKLAPDLVETLMWASDVALTHCHFRVEEIQKRARAERYWASHAPATPALKPSDT